jgi:hypothetical protein
MEVFCSCSLHIRNVQGLAEEPQSGRICIEARLPQGMKGRYEEAWLCARRM